MWAQPLRKATSSPDRPHCRHWPPPAQSMTKSSTPSSLAPSPSAWTNSSSKPIPRIFAASPLRKSWAWQSSSSLVVTTTENSSASATMLTMNTIPRSSTTSPLRNQMWNVWDEMCSLRSLGLLALLSSGMPEDDWCSGWRRAHLTTMTHAHIH